MITLILDNAGGVILQSNAWAGYWHDGPEAAETLAELLNGADPEMDGWESNPDAEGVECTLDDIQRGGCQEIKISDWNDLFEVLDEDSSWFNEVALLRRMRELQLHT